jgi:hypothetical protein
VVEVPTEGEEGTTSAWACSEKRPFEEGEGEDIGVGGVGWELEELGGVQLKEVHHQYQGQKSYCWPSVAWSTRPYTVGVVQPIGHTGKDTTPPLVDTAIEPFGRTVGLVGSFLVPIVVFVVVLAIFQVFSPGAFVPVLVVSVVWLQVWLAWQPLVVPLTLVGLDSFLLVRRPQPWLELWLPFAIARAAAASLTMQFLI